MKYEIICGSCPKSCLVISEIYKTNISVSGNQCLRGKEFALQEINDPQRTLTTTLKTSTGKLVSVKSTAPVSKKELSELVKELQSVTIGAPIKIGQVIVKALGENAVDIVATANLIG
jgi:CxxC motif-containing protein